ncbi:MAG: pyruvate flavodoxin/ferredoxin oxidoreductase domain-containing protein [Candidatus Aramenus sulfurataquae]|jgi:2-oxoglutarate ferredoxin oxidoreductase subunit alpha|uniref:2-oxoacid oxidoreductase (ferredoxin) n=3 Tax=Candidatus Aramenus sulfurataquae TaxID=1326980 RepID=W7KH80_9CREN|nr:MAG: pyruvate flavodoxin/ferredoxin oxidoreductase domain-containing protein [Candidatus Aramenus sulfurataquae]MCL7344600.1 2-oxoacid:acceptor oxidoreductase subunit alpha [Candidatus Aramenus sulfurataquae]
MRLNWLIGGQQGSGVDTSALVFGNALASAGYYIYGNREYYSNIKGRHSYFALTISDKRVRSFSFTVDILATFDAETLFQHFTEVKKVVIYNKSLEGTKVEYVQNMEPEIAEKVVSFLKERGYGSTVRDVVEYLKSKGVNAIGVDYDGIMRKVAEEVKLPLSVVERGKNTIAIGASYGLLGLGKGYLESAIRNVFKNETFVKLNTMSAELGMESVPVMFPLKEIPVKKERVQLDGNTAVAIGKIYGGLGFQSFYPISPASDESVYMQAHQEVWYVDPKTGDKRKKTVVVVQAEDELSAINMAIGASLTGVRAATATSGPGFSLMTEGVTWAGMNEAPVVITYYIRGGPATGQPTRTSQADLFFVMNAGHGEFPRIVIASGDHVEAFQDAVWAFNLAERYQTPVIHFVEKAIANAYSVIDLEELGLDKLRADRGDVLLSPPPDYARFKITDTGISPRAFLGSTSMFYTGDEHNEEGHIREASHVREAMYEKRLRKLETADREIPEEDRVKTFGDLDQKVVVVTWGSPKGAVLDAMEELNEEGIKFGVVQIRMFSPFPKNLIRKLLSGKEKVVDVEGSYMAQAGMAMKLFSGIEPTHYVLKWNGRPMGRDEVKEALKAVILEDRKKVVLHGGA